MEKSKVQYIRAKLKHDYIYDRIIQRGYDVFTPYYGNTILFRLLREVWFRAKLPKADIWFNKKACKLGEGKRIIVLKDPLIREDYMAWLRKNNPEKVIVLEYENRAKTTINPNKIKPYVDELLSYDMDDCIEYGMTHKDFSFACIPTTSIKSAPEIDVLFVGRDKGRVEALRNLKERMEKQGLSVLLYICANRSFQRYNKSYYKKVLDYDDYLKMAGKSRAILNIMPEGQTSITQRDVEAILYNIKEITNNVGIKNFEYYDPSRYFVLDVDDDNDMYDFIHSDFKPVPLEELKKHEDDIVLGKLLEKYM